MNLLCDPWIPVRSDGGTGEFRQITYEELLCQGGDWQISLPRDDLEMACFQLLVSLTQVLFLPTNDPSLRSRIRTPLTSREFIEGIAHGEDWFELTHPKYPFMQVRGVASEEDRPIQKLLLGLPEGNNHKFFNETGEVIHLGSACTAIALFNQASNSPSFGRGFKPGLRASAPVTTLVVGDNLRQTIWHNVITLSRIQERIPHYKPGRSDDKPTWVEPIPGNGEINETNIGLLRGLFWQPLHLELLPPEPKSHCDLLDLPCDSAFTEFRWSRFTYAVNGTWPHPHGSVTLKIKKGKEERKFLSFSYNSPAWTQLSEFVVPRSIQGNDKEGTVPAAPITQAPQLFPDHPLHMLVGGYCVKGGGDANVRERRHDLVSLAQGWDKDRGRLKQLVDLGLQAKESLRKKLYFAASGDNKRGLKGIGSDIQKIGVKLFFARTERMLHEILQDQTTFRNFKVARERWLNFLASTCMDIFEDLTNPYTMKPELIPIIAFARRLLNSELVTLKDGGGQNGGKPKKRQKKS
jgi:CRISPR system Cascade subunit CasA